MEQEHDSAINGKGYGWQHRWRYMGTPIRASLYKCADCDAKFAHHYDRTPIIFRAMAEAGIPEVCAALSTHKQQGE